MFIYPKKIAYLTYRSCAVVTAWFVLSAATCNGPAGGGGGVNPADTITQCSSEPAPTGFIKVNDDWDPTVCGKPSSVTRNISTYQRYDNKPVGTSLQVCASAAAPAGWTDGSFNWDSNRCGHPSSVTNNVKLITRSS